MLNNKREKNATQKHAYKYSHCWREIVRKIQLHVIILDVKAENNQQNIRYEK